MNYGLVTHTTILGLHRPQALKATHTRSCESNQQVNKCCRKKTAITCCTQTAMTRTTPAMYPTSPQRVTRSRHDQRSAGSADED